MNDQNKATISFVLVTHNEASRVAESLESISWADEIIVVDGESEDGTADLCRKFTDKVFVRPNNIYIQHNRNFGRDQCTTDWIMYWDADEIMREPLKKEILNVINSNPEESGFQVPRKNYFYTRFTHYSFPDYQVRLFRRGTADFADGHYHASLKIRGKMGRLRNYFLHYSMSDIHDNIAKVNKYTIYESNYEHEVKNVIIKPYNVLYHFFIKPFAHSMRIYFKDKAYKDGILGMIIAVNSGFYMFLKMAKCWEIQEHKKSIKNRKEW